MTRRRHDIANQKVQVASCSARNLTVDVVHMRLMMRLLLLWITLAPAMLIASLTHRQGVSLGTGAISFFGRGWPVPWLMWTESGPHVFHWPSFWRAVVLYGGLSAVAVAGTGIALHLAGLRTRRGTPDANNTVDSYR